MPSHSEEILLLSQHGRIKVRTTAEQAEAKRKEREKKLKIYQETMSRIYEKVYPAIMIGLELLRKYFKLWCGEKCWYSKVSAPAHVPQRST